MEIPFDGLLTLLIFLVGIPALILQMISAAERRAVMKKGNLDVKAFLKKASIVVIVGLTMQFVLVLTLEADRLNIDKGKAVVEVVEQLVWIGLFGTLFYLVWQVSQDIPEQYGRREKIIEKITEDTKREATSKPLPRVGGEAFTDLANLGKQCDPGHEREMVVDAFKKLVLSIIADEKYNGDSFEELIEELVHMLVSNPEPKDLCCYDTAIKILAVILSTNNDFNSDGDKRRALHAISKLGRTLLEHFKSVEADNIILDYVDSVEFAILDSVGLLTEVSQTLFQIGICASDAGQDFIAVAALDKVTVLAENHQPLPEEFVADMLGLVAHLWVMDGSRQGFAVQKLEEVKGLLPQGLTQSIVDARAHCLRTMYFDTADNLEAMKKGLRSRKKK